MDEYSAPAAKMFAGFAIAVWMYVLLFWLVLAWVISRIAEKKGKSPLPWGIYGFFFWPAALLQLLVVEDDETSLRTKEMRTCPQCCMSVSRQASKCPYCQSELPPIVRSARR